MTGSDGPAVKVDDGVTSGVLLAGLITSGPWLLRFLVVEDPLCWRTNHAGSSCIVPTHKNRGDQHTMSGKKSQLGQSKPAGSPPGSKPNIVVILGR